MFITLKLYNRSNDLFECVCINTDYIVATHRPNTEQQEAGFRSFLQFAPDCAPHGYATPKAFYSGLVAVDEEYEVLVCMLSNDHHTLRILEKEQKRQEREEASKQRALARAERNKAVSRVTDLNLKEKEEPVGDEVTKKLMDVAVAVGKKTKKK